MNDEKILKKLEEQDKKLEAIYISVEKTRRYFLWTLIITVAMIILPLIGILILLSRILDIYSNILGM